MATATAPPQSARKRYAFSALLAARAASEATKARPSGLLAVAKVVRVHQVTQAVMAERAVVEMLAEQRIQADADALLNSLAFTTEVERLGKMIDATEAAEFERLIASIVQDVGRTAESVAVAVRPNVHHVRYVSLPCCSRCAVLAGRVYRWSAGFQRHPQCDCSMIPTTVASPLRQSPEDLLASGQVRGLSKADEQAIADGADMGRVVNVRRRSAGLNESGRVLARAGRPTPEGIYRMAGDDRAKAVELLTKYRYLR